MKAKIIDSLLMFLIQLVSYTLLVVNYRAVAHANYFWSASTDFAIASFNFFIIKRRLRIEKINNFIKVD